MNWKNSAVKRVATSKGIKLDDIKGWDLKRMYYEDGHDYCALCGIPDRKTYDERQPGGLQMAHILGGCNRMNQPWNILMLCEACHRAHHNINVHVDSHGLWPNVTTGMLIAAKKGIGELNGMLLAALWNRTPEYVEDLSETDLPQFFLDQRERWGTHDASPIS